MSSRLKEKFLLFRIRAKKDPEAFGQIYDAYVEPIYRFIYFKVSSAEQAEDLTSETFLKAWQYLKEKKDVPHLQALLYSVARSVVIDHYRAVASERGDQPLDEAQASELTDDASEKLLRDVETKFDTTLVIEKLRRLKDEYREVIVMKYLDELNTREIAQALGKSSANVRVILHRATQALARACAGQGPGIISHDQQGTQENPPKH
jgi:RNA polymerase sigma-70 factor (ECF subfamily)